MLKPPALRNNVGIEHQGSGADKPRDVYGSILDHINVWLFYMLDLLETKGRAFLDLKKEKNMLVNSVDEGRPK